MLGNDSCLSSYRKSSDHALHFLITTLGVLCIRYVRYYIPNRADNLLDISYVLLYSHSILILKCRNRNIVLIKSILHQKYQVRLF